MDRGCTFREMSDDIAKNYQDKLRQKYWFINLNGLFVKLSGGRVCNKVVRLNNGFLTGVRADSFDVTEHAEKLAEMSATLEKKGIPFLYVQAPTKIDLENAVLPEGVINAENENADNFLSYIRKRGVRTLDLRTDMADTPEHIEEYFYVTDHHWNALGAFRGFQEISDCLQEIFPDEKIIGKYQDIENWEVHTKEDWWLGSHGKRTGSHFVGADDLIWLTPGFDTELSYARIYEHEFRYGDYEDAVIWDKYTEKPDYFPKDAGAYNVYAKGGEKLTQLRNPKAPVDRKLLLIKDSFSVSA